MLGFLGNITSASCCATIRWRGIVAVPQQRSNENKMYPRNNETDASTQQRNGDVSMEELQVN
jgi:hypothetical protein